MAVDYQPRIELPAEYVRGSEKTAELAVYLDSVLTAPSAGTFSLRRPDGTLAVDGEAVTVVSSVATRAVTLATTESLGEGWQEEWTLTLDGVDVIFYRDAAVVLREYRNVVTTADLLRRHQDLANQYPEGSTTFEDALSEAWVKVALYLIQQGRRPYLIVNPWTLREPTLLWALCFAFRAASTFTGEGSRFSFFADKYEQDAMRALEDMVLTYDDDGNNQPDEAEQGQSAASVLFLSNPPRGAFWRSHLPPPRRF